MVFSFLEIDPELIKRVSLLQYSLVMLEQLNDLFKTERMPVNVSGVDGWTVLHLRA